MHSDSESLIIFFIFHALKCQLSVRKTNLVSEHKMMKILVNDINSKRLLEKYSYYIKK